MNDLQRVRNVELTSKNSLIVKDSELLHQIGFPFGIFKML